MNRRTFLIGVGMVGLNPPSLRAQVTAPGNLSVKAMVFDTFGTVVDWRGSIIEEGSAWGKQKKIDVDWADFADQWRAGYAPSMEKVRKGELPWTKLDDLHRSLLEELLTKFHVDGLSEEEKNHWNRVWHRLKPWPDSVRGLTRLKKKYIIAPLSNGNVGLLTDMAKNSGLPWDAILGAELVRHYKPDREVYLSAAEFLGLKPQEVMMCAAHVGDLMAARNLGLRTGFIYRPNEFGSTRKPDVAKEGDFDVVSNSIVELAAKMGA
jgi:2-haloacid dehalogenase